MGIKNDLQEKKKDSMYIRNNTLRKYNNYTKYNKNTKVKVLNVRF